MNEEVTRSITSFLKTQHQALTQFLAELVKVPSDNPPGDCQRHAERTAELLEETWVNPGTTSGAAGACRPTA